MQHKRVLPRHLVLYDGFCPLCARAVRFLLFIDARRVLVFAPLHGETVKRLADLNLRIRMTNETILYIRTKAGTEFEVFQRSSAIIEIAKAVGGIWRILVVLKVLPAFVRDGVYDWIADNRYSWFGRYEDCRLPSPEERERFLD